jgi:hypothetical protein
VRRAPFVGGADEQRRIVRHPHCRGCGGNSHSGPCISTVPISAAEGGFARPQGLRNVGKLIAIVRDEGDGRLPDLARQVLAVLAAKIEQLEGAVAALEKQLIAWHKSNPVSQRLASVPGIGPIIATAIAATVVERAASAVGASLRPGWVWYHGRIPPAANIAWAGYPSAATNICAGF